jgi:hypothetical protein
VADYDVSPRDYKGTSLRQLTMHLAAFSAVLSPAMKMSPY